MNAAELLANSLSPDQATRESATNQLEAAARDNFHAYMHTLAAELANESSDPTTRQAAGLAFKNALAARNQFNQATLTERWLALPESATTPLKESLLSTLGSPRKTIGAVAAQCVSAVAAIELPAQKWSELIPRLLEFVSNTSNIPLRVNTLQAVGYVCEVISPEILASRSNEILTAVVQGARREEPVSEVQQAAVHALYNSLEFIRDNFEREGERNYIMQVVCEATQNQSVQVQVAAFECLVKIMSLYYEKMDFYMEQALFGLTILGMKHPEESVALQAIEFWSTVCEEEIDLAIEAQEAASYGEQPAVQSHQFARLAATQILPVLLELLTQQEEDADEEEWTKAMAAAACLELLARDIGDEIVSNVVPFVEGGITQAEWQRREAAVMAFGAILDGPEPATLAPLVTQALGTLINMMQNDPSIQVRDTVAWTLSKISEVMLEVIDTSMHLENLVSALVVGLNAQPRIITSCCSALSNLVVQLSQPPSNDADAEVTTCPMSPYFSRVIQTLMTLSEKPTNEGNSRSAAYSTISTFITSSANDTLPVVQDIAVAMITRQEQLMGMQAQLVGLDDRNNWNDMQIQICVVLQSVINKSPPMIAPFADRIMTNLLSLISSAGRLSGVLEDAYATVSALATALESGFAKYLEAFTPFMFSALGLYEDWQVAQAAVFAVSDISRSVSEAMAPYTQQIMVALVELLQSPQIVRSVKPHAVTAMGELAMAVGPVFVPFLETIMNILSQAGASAAGSNNDADIEFVWNMRESIVDAFIGILNGLKGADPQPFLRFVPGIMGFLQQCWVDDERTETFSLSVLGLIGDFATTYKSAVKEQMFQSWVQNAVSVGRERSQSRNARGVALYAQKAIKEIK